jgi:hypothetical protein
MNPMKVELNGGKAGLTGQRPASSHSPKNRAKEASCQRRNYFSFASAACSGARCQKSSIFGFSFLIEPDSA